MSEQSDVTGPLLAAIRQAGTWATRLQSGRVKVRGGWMYLCPPGTADLLAFPEGKPCWVETKDLKGDQHDAQIKFQRTVEMMGHRYIVCRSVKDGLDAVLGREIR